MARLPTRALALVLLLLPAGCGSHRHAQPEPGRGAELVLLHPAAGDTVAGEVSLEAAVRTAALPGRLIFLADDEPVDTLFSPPWLAIWSAEAPPEGRGRTLRVVADGHPAEGEEWEEICRSPPVPVWVWPDSAPQITVTLPSPTPCFERRDGLFVEATAADPEEGALSPEAIVWTGDRMSRPFAGARLPLECLSDGRQALTAEAADRWGRRGKKTVVLCPFRYRSGKSPEDCLENLAFGLQSLDQDACLAQTDSAFLFLPCPAQAEAAGWPRIWPRAEFEGLLRSWLGSRPGTTIFLEWTLGRASTWAVGGVSWGWISVSEIGLNSSLPGAPEQGDPLSADGGGYALLARRPGGSWRILQWRDFPPSTGSGLASFLARAGGLPLPPTGPACGMP